jgi:uncharacterized protein (TIGR03000 family)
MFRNHFPHPWAASVLALALLAPPLRALDFDYPSLGWYLFKGPIYPQRYWLPPAQYGYTMFDSFPTPIGGLNYPNYIPGGNLNFPTFGGMNLYGYGFNAYLTQRYLRNGPYFDRYGQFRPHPWSLPVPFQPLDPVAHFLIRVPADADIWLDGAPTHQTGASRRFVTPPLEFGEKFVYTVRARWTEDGRVVEQSKELVVGAGDWVSITFPTPIPPPAGQAAEVSARPASDR